MNMVREKLIKQARDEDEKMLISRAIDLIERAKNNNSPEYTAFLSPNGQQLFELVAKSVGVMNWHSFGGVEQAERKKMVLWPSDCDWYQPEFDMDLIKITSPANALLTHSDYLGALVGLGLKRDVIGDIFVENTHAYVVVEQKISQFIIDNLTQVSSVAVEVELDKFENLDVKEPQYEVLSVTLVSLRLDSVIAKAFQLSRGVAANFIKQGRVKVDHRVTNSPSINIEEGSVISCRGRGRCVILKNAGKTRKGRIKLEIGFPLKV